jgi:hypothetical protein
MPLGISSYQIATGDCPFSRAPEYSQRVREKMEREDLGDGALRAGAAGMGRAWQLHIAVLVNNQAAVSLLSLASLRQDAVEHCRASFRVRG